MNWLVFTCFDELDSFASFELRRIGHPWLCAALMLALAFVACVTSGGASARTTSDVSSHHILSSCPSGSERTQSMVENFLTNPRGTEARQETGTTGLSPDQIQLVQDENVCQQLNQEYDSQEFSDYNIAYYKAGNFYFVAQVLKQPDDPNIVVSGLSMIYIYDENLTFIKGYSG